MAQREWESGTSTTTKVIIALVAAGGLALALCCGGLFWLGMRAQEFVGEFQDAVAEAVTQDPDEIRTITDSMVSIDVPEGWQPVMGMEWNLGAEMTSVTYSPNQMQPGRVLVLMQTKGQGMNQQQWEQQLRMQSHQQDINPELGVTETRSFLIDGEERDFHFVTVTDAAGSTMHHVRGVVPGRNGTVMLTFTEDEANWDEEVVVRMIGSISTQTTTETVDSDASVPQETVE